MYRYWLLICSLLLCACENTDSSEVVASSMGGNFEESVPSLSVGAQNLQLYVPGLSGKKVGLVANQSSLVGDKHLLDTLLQLEVNVVKLFTPEHGFRGKADAGAKIDDSQDSETGLPIISLYGSNKKPKSRDLEGLDVIIFDLQDVGVRCYTYISTLHYIMDACVEANIQCVVLDRPNPNGHFVDGPMLDPKFKSFVGMHPVPFVHGMTIGEYAKMIKGESWISNAEELDLKVVPCQQYERTDRYPLPVPPSPNLPNYKSVLLYPSLVFFEGTTVSVGRGTETPFQVYGHPDWLHRSFVFKPVSREGATNPKHLGKACGGSNLVATDDHNIKQESKIQLNWLINAQRETKTKFFLDNNFMDKLAGTDALRKDIIAGKNEDEIRAGWKEDLAQFKIMRQKYLIYEDI